MDTYECIITKLDIREYSAQDVPLEIRQRILEVQYLQEQVLILNIGNLF